MTKAVNKQLISCFLKYLILKLFSVFLQRVQIYSVLKSGSNCDLTIYYKGEFGSSLLADMVKDLPARQETWV